MGTALIVMAMAGAVATPLAGEGRPVAEIVERVQARFDTMKDWSARVRQELVIASTGRKITAVGTVAFKRPGKMRWTLENGESQVIVADGATLWFYQPEEEQVLTAPFQRVFRSTTPISFLTGVGRIKEDFEVELGSREGDLVQLVLQPRRGAQEIGHLRLTVETKSYDIVVAEIHDPLGNITRLHFSELQRNTGLPDSLFRFEVPPGVDVIEAPIGY